MGALCCRPQVRSLSFLPLFRPNIPFKGHRFRCRCQPLPFHAPQMCRKRCFWKGTVLLRSSRSPHQSSTSPRFASFNTSRHATCTPSNISTKQNAVRMKAVANVIQERRLLEEVCLPLLAFPFTSDLSSDRPSFCRQPTICLPRRRELFFCLGFNAWG